MSCTCTWSVVRTSMIDPPHIAKRDINCIYHGDCPDCGVEMNEGHCNFCGYDIDDDEEPDEPDDHL